MSGFFQRLFTLGQAEGHNLINKLEDPVKMTEQGIRQLQENLAKATESFAQVKAVSIRAQKDAEKAKLEAGEWEQKAMALLQQAQAGRLTPEDADRLAVEALTRKEEAEKRYALSIETHSKQQQTVGQMQQNIEKLKSQIGQYQNELVTLKARSTTAKATERINRQLAQVDSSGTLSMLERMREKVEEQETLAQAFGEVAQKTGSIEDEINQALLGSGSSLSQQKALEEMKAKLQTEPPKLQAETQGPPANRELEALKSKMGLPKT